MKKRIAVVFSGDLSINRQGQINSAINRVKHLMQMDVFDIDVYCVHMYDWGLLRILHKNKRIKKRPVLEVDGIPVIVIYKRNILIDLVLSRLQTVSLYSSYCCRMIAKQLKDYDLIVGHSTIGGTLGRIANELYKKPYCVVWHGSDIHSFPVSNSYIKKATNRILSNSSANIFVSYSLLNDAQRLFGNIPYPHIAFNAPSEAFVRYDESKRAELRKRENVMGKKIVAYVGNLFPVKNVFTLPGIFKRVQAKCTDAVFWIVGNGIYSEKLRQMMKDEGVECRFWGNQQPEKMPDIMNCIDVLVLPSKNESFGMVLVEAISCGANAVGSRRGGIPEVIGNENCFDLDESFEERTAERIVYMLNNKVYQHINSEYNWNITAAKESDIYISILTNKR